MVPRTVLLTGASGVVGRAVLAALEGHRVICLTHRRQPARGWRVTGDASRPDLGVPAGLYRMLVDTVDTVVHCAAVTDFTAGADEIHRLNVAGTRHVAQLAERAGAHLHYVSTAFVARTLHAAPAQEAATDPGPYLESKRAAEDVVRAAGVPTTILRPSVVIGDRRTGEIAKFQGLHTLALGVLRGSLPVLPLPPESRIDVVPQDLVAEAVRAVVEGGASGAEYWVTAGDRALSARQMLDLTLSVAAEAGLRVPPPRMVDPDMVSRLIRPVFVASLPPGLRRRFDSMVALTALFAGAEPLPSSLAPDPGAEPLPSSLAPDPGAEPSRGTVPRVSAPSRDELAVAYRRSVEYLARAKGLAGERVGAERAA